MKSIFGQVGDWRSYPITVYLYVNYNLIDYNHRFRFSSTWYTKSMR